MQGCLKEPPSVEKLIPMWAALVAFWLVMLALIEWRTPWAMLDLAALCFSQYHLLWLVRLELWLRQIAAQALAQMTKQQEAYLDALQSAEPGEIIIAV